MKEKNFEQPTQRRRCSSVEAKHININHLEVEGDIYAIVSPKIKKRSKKNLTQISPNVNAQLSPDSTRQIESWIHGKNDRSQSPTSPVMVNKLPAKKNNNKPNGPDSISKVPVSPVPRKRPQNVDAKERKLKSPTPTLTYTTLNFDMGMEKGPKSAFQMEYDAQGYGTIVFEQDSLDRMRQNRPLPSAPAKYTGVMPKIVSDTRSSGRDGANSHDGKVNTTLPNHSANAASPKLVKSRSYENTMDGSVEEPPYINVRRDMRQTRPPAIPPHHWAPIITVD